MRKIAKFFATGTPPPPPYFAMCMLIKDLQRSVVDRYANKGLSGDVELVAPGAPRSSGEAGERGVLELGSELKYSEHTTQQLTKLLVPFF